MPAAESFTQSIGTPRTYRLKDGRTVELRNGCVVDTVTRYTLAGSGTSKAYLLAHAKLTDDERRWLEEWGDDVFHSASGTPLSRAQVARMKN